MRARVWIATLTSATLAATVGLFGAGTLSTANASGPTAQPAGTLALTTTTGVGVDGWSFTKTGNVSGTPDANQAVAAVAGTCNLTPTSGPLVNLSATNGAAASLVGYAAHSIGVTQGVTNSACNKVGINKTTTKPAKGPAVTTTSVESLTLALNTGPGGALSDPLFGPFQASGATLDLEVHEGTQVQASVSLANGAPTVYTLIAYDADDSKPTAPLPPNTTWCTIADDDEHATAQGDNCTWTIPGPNFDKVVLTPVAGWFSLEGGGDWPAASGDHRSTFSMVSFFDGTFAACDGTDSQTTFGGGTVKSADLTRLVSGEPSQCNPLPYTLDTTAAGTTFHKPTPSGDTSQFAIALTRTYAAPVPNPVKAAIVNWEDGTAGEDGQGNHSLAFCKPGLIDSVDANNLPVGIHYANLDAVTDDQSPKDGLQYACVYQQLPVYNLQTGSLTMTDWIYFTGDVRFGAP